MKRRLAEEQLPNAMVQSSASVAFEEAYVKRRKLS